MGERKEKGDRFGSQDAGELTRGEVKGPEAPTANDTAKAGSPRIPGPRLPLSLLFLLFLLRLVFKLRVPNSTRTLPFFFTSMHVTCRSLEDVTPPRTALALQSPETKTQAVSTSLRREWTECDCWDHRSNTVEQGISEVEGLSASRSSSLTTLRFSCLHVSNEPCVPMYPPAFSFGGTPLQHTRIAYTTCAALPLQNVDRPRTCRALSV